MAVHKWKDLRKKSKLTDARRAETDRRVQIEAVHLSLKALRELLKKT